MMFAFIGVCISMKANVMTDQFAPLGPYYLTLNCENADAAEIIDVAYVDGFETEADAWKACLNIGKVSTDAIDEFGEDVTVAGETVLQVTIAKAVGADFPCSFAA